MVTEEVAKIFLANDNAKLYAAIVASICLWAIVCVWGARVCVCGRVGSASHTAWADETGGTGAWGTWPGHRMGTAWARHGHGMGTAWAPHGHRMGTAWARHVTRTLRACRV